MPTVDPLREKLIELIGRDVGDSSEFMERIHRRLAVTWSMYDRRQVELHDIVAVAELMQQRIAAGKYNSLPTTSLTVLELKSSRAPITCMETMARTQWVSQ